MSAGYTGRDRGLSVWVGGDVGVEGLPAWEKTLFFLKVESKSVVLGTVPTTVPAAQQSRTR